MDAEISLLISLQMWCNLQSLTIKENNFVCVFDTIHASE